MEALSLDEDFYRVIGDASSAGVVVSRTEDPVDFADRLRNRVVNLVPVEDIGQATRWVSEATQTVGHLPRGAARAAPRPARPQRRPAHPGRCGPPRAADVYGSGRSTLLLPHDGMEPMRRMVRWTIDQG